MKRNFLLLLLALNVISACKGQSNNVSNPVSGSPQKLLSDKRAYYPRVIRLSQQKEGNGNLIASFDSDGNTANFFKSVDDGKTWNLFSSFEEISPPGHCCSGLYEVSEKVGNTEAGTLFWTTSIGKGQDPRVNTAIKIYQSKDLGKTWNFLSNPVSGNTGLWEAEFIINDKKQLIIYYSTEEHKDKGYNQLLAHKVSDDGGLTWSAEVPDVAINDGKQRPGMAIVRRLSNGTYIMSYEICGSGCDVFIRTSQDGLNWGDPTDRGTRVESSNGNHFAHAPTITISPDNDILVIGQLLMNNSTNKMTASNGKVLMINSNNGKGLWKEIPSPVAVENAIDDPCPNYSSQLLISANKKDIIEIAIQYNGGICNAYYNTLPFKR